MKKLLFFFFLLLSASLFADSFTHNGLLRQYFKHIPKGYNANKKVALLLLLHGGGGNGKRIGNFTGFNELSDKDTFIVVSPDAWQKHWNDGRTHPRYESQSNNIDDVGFLSALIDTIMKHYNIDSKRVYATGLSNGGMMSYRLACQLSGKITAAVCVISNMPENLVSTCQPGKEMPIMIINGDADPLMPFQGGDVRFGKDTLGKVVSTDATVKFWLNNNKCNLTAQRTSIPDISSLDNTTIVKDEYGGCSNNASVVLYTVKNGGHTYPGSRQYAPVRIIGQTSQDMKAADVSWDFLKQYRNLY